MKIPRRVFSHSVEDPFNRRQNYIGIKLMVLRNKEIGKAITFNFEKDLEKDLVLILSNDEWSSKQYNLLVKEDVIDKFEITYSPDWIKDLKVIGFPTFYCRSTRKSCVGYDNYSSVISKITTK
jgi:hypothetical protein